jgi:hypothetical protein
VSAHQTSDQTPDFSNRRLLQSVAVCVALVVIWFLLRPWLPAPWRKPGSPELYLLGVLGTLLLLMPLVFTLAKRSGQAADPIFWFNAHVGCALLGMVLIAIHSGLLLRRAPALLLLNLLAVLGLGVWGRIRGARLMAATFAGAAPTFAAPDAATRGRLQALLRAKRMLLVQLAPQASEATFHLRAKHWLRSPRLARDYARLVQQETRLLARRQAVSAPQAWWRPLHIALAMSFVLGLIIHVLVVTFFAGYVAAGEPIDWWHLREW